MFVNAKASSEAQDGSTSLPAPAVNLLNTPLTFPVRGEMTVSHGSPVLPLWVEKTAMESAMAKLYASEAACRICDEGVQIHRGYGFIKDYPAAKFYRDVRLCPIGEGTSEIQRMVIARELLGKAPSRG
jgi:alkylation response protein AidB-like acyl-CoA dehydrogenase